MKGPIFTEYRRDLIARTLFDLFKIAVAAALASRFFFEFPRQAKLAIGAAIMAVGVVGIFVCPPKKPKE